MANVVVDGLPFTFTSTETELDDTAATVGALGTFASVRNVPSAE